MSWGQPGATPPSPPTPPPTTTRAPTTTPPITPPSPTTTTTPPPPAGADAAPLDAAPPAESTATGIDPRSDVAWQFYHDAFAALMAGRRTRARFLARALAHDYPDHPAAHLVREAHLTVGLPTADESTVVEQAQAPAEDPSRGARAELALFQALHGTVLGIEVCVVLQCDDVQAFIGVPLAGAGLGTLVSLSLGDLTPGKRALLNSGTAWGAINAGLLLFSYQPDDERGAALLLIAGQGVGVIAGAALFAAHPTAGQVALANSGGAWTGVLAGLTLAASGAQLDDRGFALATVAAIDAGLAGGGYLASRWPQVSRGQTLVIDAGGIVGGVGGAAIAVVLTGSGGRAASGLAAVGAAAGLGAAAYFTRDWNDDSASPVHAYIAPPEHGRGGVAGLGFHW